MMCMDVVPTVIKLVHDGSANYTQYPLDWLTLSTFLFHDHYILSFHLSNLFS
jgi:hypothetical protein